MRFTSSQFSAQLTAIHIRQMAIDESERDPTAIAFQKLQAVGAIGSADYLHFQSLQQMGKQLGQTVLVLHEQHQSGGRTLNLI
jgi:hypothetical protein